jgi:hypothetical protein
VPLNLAGGIGWPQTVILGVISAILLGGTVALLFIGRTVPDFLIGFDGAIVMGLVSHGGFLSLVKSNQQAMAGNQQTTQQAITSLQSAHLDGISHMRDVIAREHELAMTMTGKTSTLPVTGS